MVVTLLRSLGRPVPQRMDTTSPSTPLDEDDVLAALALVEELDSQLRDARLGYRGAGWRAARLAERLWGAVETLSAGGGDRTDPGTGGS